MHTEKNSKERKRTFTCCDCEGIDEMIKGCFPDDAGYSACLAMMKEGRGKFCGQKSGDAVNEENRGCCS